MLWFRTLLWATLLPAVVAGQTPSTLDYTQWRGNGRDASASGFIPAGDVARAAHARMECRRRRGIRHAARRRSGIRSPPVRPGRSRRCQAGIFIKDVKSLTLCTVCS